MASTTATDDVLSAIEQPAFVPERPPFRPQPTEFEMYLIAADAFGVAYRQFRSRVTATKHIRAYKTDRECYDNDDGTLEDLWTDVRRASSKAEEILIKML